MGLNKRILLIDDDSVACALNKMIIERSQLVDEVLTFTDPIEALSYVLKKGTSDQHDLILLDLNMPVMNGWEFIKAYEEKKIEEKPIVILSSSIDPVDVSKANDEPGVSEYMSKPLSVKMLEQLVEKYLN